MINGFRKRKWATVFFIAWVMLLLVGCTPKGGSNAPSAGKAVEPVKIGGILSLTGPSGSYVRNVQAGADFVVEEINKAGGVKSLGGAPIKVVWADDASDPKVGATEAERLIVTEKPVLMFGPRPTTLVTSILPLADKYKMPFVTTGPIEPVQDLKLRYVVFVQYTNDGLTKSYPRLLKALIDEYKVPNERIAIVVTDDLAGKLFMDGMTTGLKEVGLADKVVLNLRVDPKAPDQTVNLVAIKAKNPDVVFNQGYLPIQYGLHKARVSMDWHPPTWFGLFVGISSKTVWDAIGKEMADAALLRPGVYGIETFADTVAHKPMQDFVAKTRDFARARNMVPDSEYTFGAQAMYVAYRALEAAGSRDPEAINNALHKVVLREDDPMMIVPTFRPSLEFQTDGRVKSDDFLLVQWNKDGSKLEVIYPKKLRTAEARVK